MPLSLQTIILPSKCFKDQSMTSDNSETWAVAMALTQNTTANEKSYSGETMPTPVIGKVIFADNISD